MRVKSRGFHVSPQGRYRSQAIDAVDRHIVTVVEWAACATRVTQIVIIDLIVSTVRMTDVVALIMGSAIGVVLGLSFPRSSLMLHGCHV
jgi:hypothetical protein